MNFKKIVKYVLILLLCALAITSFFFVKNYINQTKKYNEYKTNSEEMVKRNKQVSSRINDLLAQQIIYDNEKNNLLSQIKEKETIILEKEKKIVENNKIIIPIDYNNLKQNYLTLYDIYLDQKSINELLSKQIEDDSIQISNLTLELEESKNQINGSSNLLTNSVEKPVPFIQQSVLIGGGLNSDNEKSIYVGYGILLKDKIIVQVQIGYKPQVLVSFGVKF